jgi:hypothetical protein
MVISIGLLICAAAPLSYLARPARERGGSEPASSPSTTAADALAFGRTYDQSPMVKRRCL